MEKAEAALESTVDKAKSAMDKAAQKVSDLVPDAIEERALAMRNQMSGVFSEFITFINRGVSQAKPSATCFSLQKLTL